MLLLMELLKDWPCTISGGNYTTPVFGITENSSTVSEGYIFVARKGGHQDGSFHIDEAMRRGAVALVIDRTDIQGLPKGIPVVVVPDCKKFISHASARFAGDPSSRLTVIAITGTNGKTTVAHFTGQLLKAAGKRAAVIGTTGLFIDGQQVDYRMPAMTTPSAEYLHPLLRKCEEEGVTHVVMEASSLGLSMCRLDHCKIDVGVLLNIGTDHYEEHGSKQAYIRAKKKLIELAGVMIVNMEDRQCLEMVEYSDTPIIYFDSESHPPFFKKGASWELLIPGRHNQLNAFAALTVMEVLGFPPDETYRHVHVLKLPEGRLQLLERDGVLVYIDYAHTPDALRAVLETLTANCYGKLITVFGCGGDRDKGKRREMGELAVNYSSIVIVTTDNPRSENPLEIVADIMSGFGGDCSTVEAVLDRKTAIRKAVFTAAPGDIVLIAGKGHEKTQHTAKGIFPFSDVDEAKQALSEKTAKAHSEMDSE